MFWSWPDVTAAGCLLAIPSGISGISIYLGLNAMNAHWRFNQVGETHNQPFTLSLNGSLSNVRVWMAIIFGIGLAVRMSLILVTRQSASYGGELFNIALSLANHGTYADAFGSGSGPTAHGSPALPIILAFIIRVAGAGPAGHLVNSTLAAIVAATAFALLPALAVKCRLGMSPGVTAGLVGAALPINYWAQTAGY
jgi:hypothetical protein